MNWEITLRAIEDGIAKYEPFTSAITTPMNSPLELTSAAPIALGWVTDPVCFEPASNIGIRTASPVLPNAVFANTPPSLNT
ncbi:unannotated protein [freshwater metagenome]|uniref:Unannotated protein n=1 Tax=freshwater metagenome TaxID=449393 RepID=A0A6J6W0S0_9ZZZZ